MNVVDKRMAPSSAQADDSADRVLINRAYRLAGAKGYKINSMVLSVISRRDYDQCTGAAGISALIAAAKKRGQNSIVLLLPPNIRREAIHAVLFNGRLPNFLVPGKVSDIFQLTDADQKLVSDSELVEAPGPDQAGLPEFVRFKIKTDNGVELPSYQPVAANAANKP